MKYVRCATRDGLGLVLVLVVAGCAANTTSMPGPTDSGISLDGGPWADGGPADASATDAGPIDGGLSDVGPRGDARTCTACTREADCAAGWHCVAVWIGVRACAPACDPGAPVCGRGFTCERATRDATAPVCRPEGICCVDEDGDGYGEGVGCRGADCDDSTGAVSAGAAELCNEVDDDCDGDTDEGCPVGVALGAPRVGASFGGSGGDAFGRPCPAGHAIVGWSGQSGGRLDALAPICGELVLAVDRSTSPEHAYRVGIGTAASIPVVGGQGGSAFGPDRCGSDEIAIGLRGRSGGEIDGAQLQCGRVSATRDGDGFRVVIEPTGTTPARGGTGGSEFSSSCPAGAVLTGISGRSAERIDALATNCADVTLTPR